MLLVGVGYGSADPQRPPGTGQAGAGHVEPRGPRSGGEQRRPGRRHRKLRRPDRIAAIAREKLGLVGQDEIVFIDTSK